MTQIVKAYLILLLTPFTWLSIAQTANWHIETLPAHNMILHKPLHNAIYYLFKIGLDTTPLHRHLPQHHYNYDNIIRQLRDLLTVMLMWMTLSNHNVIVSCDAHVLKWLPSNQYTKRGQNMNIDTHMRWLAFGDLMVWFDGIDRESERDVNKLPQPAQIP